MVLPLLKLGTLVLKTLSKPVANKLKKQAAIHPRFRQLIIRLAQANHRITTQMQRRLYSHATDVKIHPLNEEKAVQAAGDLIGEMFVFTVGGAIVIFEWQRSSRSEAKKEALRRKELEAVTNEVENLKLKMTEIDDIKLKIAELEQLAESKGVFGVFHLKNSKTDAAKLPKPV